MRPDVFRSVVLMSAPFGGPPPLPFDTAMRARRRRGLGAGRRHLTTTGRAAAAAQALPVVLLDARGRTRTCGTRRRACTPSCAPTTTARAPTGRPNKPFRCSRWTAAELAKLPTYYVMDLDKGMAETVAPEMPSAAADRRLPLAARRGAARVQRRVRAHRLPGRAAVVSLRHRAAGTRRSCRLFSGRTIDVPSCFIAGASDWGIYQQPGDLERMQTSACTQMRGVHLVDGAGHWVQQEQPEEVSRLLIEFVQR